MTVTPGTRFGTYEVTALLGAGGMGEVYRARDARLGRDVALKVLAPRLADNHEAVARFEQEARSASALSHPHILHIYDIGTTAVASESVRYIVMELVDGETLTARMQTADLREVLEWLAQVADGLAKAHAAGIIHRDLKPDNVMVSRDGYAKILDFGLAKLVEPKSPADPDAATMVGSGPVHSTPGVVLGTACYMSPEQAHGQPADARTDVFALGCMVYEAAAHRRAFAGKSLVDTLHKVIYAEPDYAGLDERLARVARKCLAKNPAERYQSVRDVGRELREIGSSATTHTVAAKSEPETIAVLPFDDFSPDRGNEYFADGVTEEITSDLSKVRSLRVISRASVRKYRGDEKDIARVASELGVAFVIDGSVRRAGNQLRVTAQLIDARNGTQLWSEKYSGAVEEVFDIQESVARSVVDRLKVELTTGENELLAQRPISNIEVYDCYLRARRNIARFDEEGLNAAIRDIEKGRALAPSNVALLSIEGYVYFQFYNLGLRPDPAYLDRAFAIARVIEDKEPGSPHAHRLFGLVASQRQQMRSAMEHLEKVLEHEPNDTDALMWICFLGSFCGRDVAPEAERLAAVDPLSATTFAARACPLVFAEGDFEAGLPLIGRAAEIAGTIFANVYVQMLAVAGRVEELRRMLPAIEAAGNEDPLFGPVRIVLARAATGDREGAAARLTNDILQAARLDYQYSSWIAEIYALLGEIEPALEWLEHSIVRGYTPWPFMRLHDRLLDPLRGDARFDALLDRARVEWESYQRPRAGA